MGVNLFQAETGRCLLLLMEVRNFVNMILKKCCRSFTEIPSVLRKLFLINDNIDKRNNFLPPTATAVCGLIKRPFSGILRAACCLFCPLLS